ncbi:hypothetical protein BD289DRAFT_376535 [Coniella lustricola]|uniref:HAUS augmin-like complex subunit 4-domain-containing protein n=1 Tax=Coniella lustricola TaxID=2025994 RepID=A0A2T2ZWL8_9PEZI|nr:hypothetical protein BD289DRAFT_376535 [Coniella lustricola]
MLPPVEDAVLQSNPEFAALYHTLTTAILNADGTTKDDHSREARERDSVHQQLDGYRLAAAKQHLLTQAISSAAPPEQRPAHSQPRRGKPSSSSSFTTDLPEPLLDLLLLLPPLLTSADQPQHQQLSSEDLNLLLSSPPFTSLPDLIFELASLVSTNLQSSAVELARIANPTVNASFVHRYIASVPTQITSTLASTQTLPARLASARLATATSLVTLLDKHTAVLTSLLGALEAKHGVVARSLELRGADVALQAQRGEIDAAMALWNLRGGVYTPEVRDALGNYAAHVRDGQRRLREAIRSIQAELAEYGVDVDGNGEGGDEVKERRFREIARTHRDVRRQIEEVKRDLSRLK